MRSDTLSKLKSMERETNKSRRILSDLLYSRKEIPNKGYEDVLRLFLSAITILERENAELERKTTQTNGIST